MQNIDSMLRSRRRFLSGAGTATLSAAAVTLLAGCNGMARSGFMGAAAQPAGPGNRQMAAADVQQDVAILNAALGLEHQAIAAYQIGAESGLLQQPVLGVAVQFQGQHRTHRDLLANTIRQLGGQPVQAMTQPEYVRSLNAAALRNQNDVLRLAHELEKGAAEAYIAGIPNFDNRDLSQTAARIVADEVMHWTVLHQVLQMPLPVPALSFGGTPGVG